MKKLKMFMVISTVTLVLYGFGPRDISIFKPLVDEPIIGGHHIIEGF